MGIWIANKSAKFHAKRHNRSENIPKSFRGATFFETPCRRASYYTAFYTACINGQVGQLGDPFSITQSNNF